MALALQASCAFRDYPALRAGLNYVDLFGPEDSRGRPASLLPNTIASTP